MLKMKHLTYRDVLDVSALQRHSRLGEGLLLAVSGGADSMALLYAMQEFVTDSPAELHVVHVNHLLRGARAIADWELVRAACSRLNIHCHYREIDPIARKPVGQTTEEYFRSQRHARFASVAAEVGVRLIATGHSADDLSETLLMHLIRGAGLHGLAFSFTSQCEDSLIVRPLWRTRRSDLLCYLGQLGAQYCEDETNASLEFTRNRIRHSLIPAIERDFNPSVRDALHRTSRVLTTAYEYIRNQADTALNQLTTMSANTEILPMTAFFKLPEIIQTEVLRNWLRSELGDSAAVSYRQIEDIRQFAASPQRNKYEHACFSLLRSSDSLFLVKTRPATEPCGHPQVDEQIAFAELARTYAEHHPGLILARIEEPIEVTIAGQEGGRVRLTSADGRRLVMRFWCDQGEELQLGLGLPNELCPSRLVIRNRTAGDRVSRSVRLKTVLINDKVPYFVRDLLVLALDPSGQVVHVAGMERINARLRQNAAYSIHSEIIAQHIL